MRAVELFYRLLGWGLIFLIPVVPVAACYASSNVEWCCDGTLMQNFGLIVGSVTAMFVLLMAGASLLGHPKK